MALYKLVIRDYDNQDSTTTIYCKSWRGCKEGIYFTDEEGHLLLYRKSDGYLFSVEEL